MTQLRRREWSYVVVGSARGPRNPYMDECTRNDDSADLDDYHLDVRVYVRHRHEHDIGGYDYLLSSVRVVR